MWGVTIRASKHKLEKKITFYVVSFQAPIQGDKQDIVIANVNALEHVEGILKTTW